VLLLRILRGEETMNRSKILDALIEIRHLLHRLMSDRRARGFLIVGQGKIETMSFNITSGQSKTATVVFTDANGKVQPLPTGNIPVWSVLPAGAVTLSPAPDGMSCAIVGGATLGPLTMTATVEGDPTPGVAPLTPSIVGTVVAPEDTQGTITVA
jgi:hypothetical protein